MRERERGRKREREREREKNFTVGESNIDSKISNFDSIFRHIFSADSCGGSHYRSSISHLTSGLLCWKSTKNRCKLRNNWNDVQISIVLNPRIYVTFFSDGCERWTYIINIVNGGCGHLHQSYIPQVVLEKYVFCKNYQYFTASPTLEFHWL